MNDQFTLCFDTMPKGTAQQKRYNGRTHTYFKSRALMEAEAVFQEALCPHVPDRASEKPVRLFVIFKFDVKDKKKWGAYKPTVPDVDNYCKAFLDQMTKTGFWKDDAQVVDLHIEKFYSEKASIYVEWEEINDA